MQKLGASSICGLLRQRQPFELRNGLGVGRGLIHVLVVEDEALVSLVVAGAR